jgi:hypothetical protein
MPVSKLYYIHSRNGRIDKGGDHSAQDVEAIIQAIRSSGKKRLAIHFHGGLVSKDAGLEIAQRLVPRYEKEAYPVFFVWESGFLETIKNNLGDIAKEPIFRQLVRKVLEHSLKRLGANVGGRSIAGNQVDAAKVRREVDAWFADPTGRPAPYAGGTPAAGTDAIRSAATAVDRMEIQADLEQDEAFKRALASVAPLPAQVRGGIGDVPQVPTQMNKDVVDQIAPPKADGQRGLLSMAKVALFVVQVVIAVVQRYAGGRDHGFYATVVEEVLRKFYIEQIGKAFFWNQMKKDTHDAFEDGPDAFAGTAFLSRLKAAMENGLQLDRIFLIGHSTGAIYIRQFLRKVEALQFDPAVVFDVILLAPAIDHVEFRKMCSEHNHRIRALRSFGMTDDVEREDGLLGDDWKRAFYPSSLLYFVSGLLEEKPDWPIVGMQRFFNESGTFKAPDFPDVPANLDWLKGAPDRMVWSIVTGGADGCRSTSRKHGDFDNDPDTVDSVVWLLGH